MVEGGDLGELELLLGGGVKEGEPAAVSGEDEAAVARTDVEGRQRAWKIEVSELAEKLVPIWSSSKEESWGSISILIFSF